MICMAVYKQNPSISTEQWLELLQNSSVFKDNDIVLMEALYNNNCRERASVLADILGVSSYRVLNLQIGS
jgi:5-methylcytosine-specific restriction enzyme A